ncbi:polysaccharide deacetylase family protein [Flavitalea flava]
MRCKSISIAFLIAITFSSLAPNPQSPKAFPKISPDTLSEKIVVLTFDDAVKSHYTVVAPLLKQYGFGATFFVCEFPPDYADTTKYMSWLQIAQLSRWGFEIGNHTRHHARVSHLTADKLNEEIGYIDRQCEIYQIPKPISFAYPAYDTASQTIPVLQQLHYTMARSGGDRSYNPKTDDPYLLPSFTPGNDAQKAIDAIKQARPGTIVILTIHGVPDNAHAWVNTDVQTFQTYCQYLADHQYTVISLKQMAGYIHKWPALK